MSKKELILKSKQIVELKNIINDLNIKLSESESLKGNFISNIMNEVYNPFSSILSMADNIISLKDNNIHKAIPMAKIIHREAAQLDFHLKNIFAAASIEAGLEETEVSEVLINDIYSSVIKKFNFDINNKKLKLSTNISNGSKVKFTSDANKLTLILLNLISNSIKYSPENGNIKCNFEIVENYLNICVCDEGKGISETDTEIVFNRFSRINQTINSVSGGTGLGLSVVKALTEILNGNIKITSENGTKVFVTIPEILLNNNELDDDTIIFDEELF